MPQVHRVRRIVRRIDPWTVFRISSIIWVVIAIGLVLGVVVFWAVLEASGIPNKITDFLIEITLLDVGENPFANTDQFLRVAVFGSMVLAAGGTGLSTLLAIIYNLVSDIVGGVELVMLEETLNAPPTVIRPQAAPVVEPAPYDIPTAENPVAKGR